MRFTACECRAEHYRRVRRSGWMRLLSSRRLYHCFGCEATLFIPYKQVDGRLFEETRSGEQTVVLPIEGPSAA